MRIRPERLRLRAGRPRWLTIGTIRLALLCGLIVVIAMLPGRLSATQAGVIGWVGLAVLAAAVSAPFLAATRKLASRFPLVEAIGMVLRHVGLVGIGAAFFLFWTFVYLTLWWRHPAEAFSGLGAAPRFADFFYYSVTTAFISPPDDIVAHSRGVRSAAMIEMLTGFAVLAAYLSSFVDWRATRAGGEEPPP